MRAFKFFLFSIVFLIFNSCMSQEFKNIIVKGKVVDKSTGKQIANAEIVALCWYEISIDDASFKKISTKTDANGNYEVKFEKGYQVDIASKKEGFYPSRKYSKLDKNKLSEDLYLQKSIENLELKYVLNLDATVLEVTDKTPFLRLKFLKNENGTLEIQNFGFDMKKMQTTLNLSEADFWFKTDTEERQPRIICSNKEGGILPIKYGEYDASLLYEKNIAPINGYVNEYELTKEDKGFFVKSRDGKTFGKIIFEDSEIDISSPDGKGNYYKEYGKNFTCLYQPNGTTNLSYNYVDIDLENFLVDGRLR